MRIGIDARLSGREHAGIGRYIEELLRSLLTIKNEHVWKIFVRKKDQLPWLKDFTSAEEIVASVPHYSLQEQLILPSLFSKEHLDLLHVPHFNVPLFYRGKFVVTIHDLLWHERKDRNATTLSPFMHDLKYHAYRFVAEQAILRARSVIVPSNAVASTVKSIVPSVSSVVTIAEGVPDAFTMKVEKANLPKLPFSSPYIVFVGSLYPHKNAGVLLQVLKQLEEMHLIVVSSRSVFRNTFEALVHREKLSKRVHFWGNMSDEGVVSLYQSALALVFPSLSEGFGLPGLESMAAGCPVIASSIPVFHEVYGKAAYFINPHSPESIVEAIQLLQQDKIFRNSLVAQGKRQLEKYSWKKAAEQTLQVYEKV